MFRPQLCHIQDHETLKTHGGRRLCY